MNKLESITQGEVTKQKKYGLKDFLKPGRSERVPLAILFGLTFGGLGSCAIAAYTNNQIDEQKLMIWLGLSTLPTLLTYLRCRWDELGPVKREWYKRDKGFY